CEGSALVAITNGMLTPWGEVSTITIEISEGRAWIVEPIERNRRVATLSGEPWSVGKFKRVNELEHVEHAIALGDIALCSYLIGAATELIRLAADHARTRRQFGRSIGEFQAVAHPLARSFSELSASSSLLLLLALDFDKKCLHQHRTSTIRKK